MQRLINVHIAVLVVLAALLFGLDQPRLLLPLIALAVAVLSVRYTDQQQRFHIGPVVVNLTIFVVAIVTGWRLLQASGWLQTAVIGQGLIALQCVLLFERKTGRCRWDLISLSLLTVFLSTSFNQDPLYGVVLIAYFFFAFSTFALLFFEREQAACEASGGQSAPVSAAAANGKSIKTNWLRLAAIAFATLIVGPLALFLRFPEPRGRDGRQRRRGAENQPGRGQAPVRQLAAAGRQDHLALLAASGREFRWRMGRITVASVLISLIVFCVTPRFGRLELELPPLSEAAWDQSPRSRLRQVGFNDRVTLGEFGSVSEDQRMVLEIQFSDYGTGELLIPQGPIYLRGAILTDYVEGHWRMREYGPPLPRIDRGNDPIVRQRIAIEQRESSDLFCVWPFLILSDNQPVRYDIRSERLHSTREMRRRTFSYELATTGFDDRVQTDLIPCRRPIRPRYLLGWPADALPTLSQLAGQWVQRADIPETDMIGRARHLTQRLQLSNRFEYSLVEPERDPSLDPIEDFVANHPQGNCEFFASALALMLRSQGIPSRLVVGYRAGSYQGATESFPVRQCDAHAWVEAYIPPERLAGYDLPPNHSDWSHGAWLRLEPTPAVSDEITGMALLAQRVKDIVGWIHATWRDNVLGMTGAQQRASIYGPLVAAVKQLAADISDSMRWTAFHPRRLWQLDARLLGRVWLACLGVALMVVLLRVRLRAMLARRRRRNGRRSGAAAGNGRAAVAFYQRLEDVLARFGQMRDSSQTQREFARTAAERIARASGQQAVSAWALEVVDAFYHVRFGAGQLDQQQTRAIEDRLGKIQQAVSSLRRDRNHR